VLPSPTVSSVPTIPSTPSPPNPDEVVASGPDSAFSPLGALLASSAAPRNLINSVIVVGFIAYRSIQLFKMWVVWWLNDPNLLKGVIDFMVLLFPCSSLK
jgi:hypothetical protein